MTTDERLARLEQYMGDIALLLSMLPWSQSVDRERLRRVASNLAPNPHADADNASTPRS